MASLKADAMQFTQQRIERRQNYINEKMSMRITKEYKKFSTFNDQRTKLK